jgi:hypothetical protein
LPCIHVFFAFLAYFEKKEMISWNQILDSNRFLTFGCGPAKIFRILEICCSRIWNKYFISWKCLKYLWSIHGSRDRVGLFYILTFLEIFHFGAHLHGFCKTDNRLVFSIYRGG